MQPIKVYTKSKSEDPRECLIPVTPEELQIYKKNAHKFLSDITKHVYHDCKQVCAMAIAEYLAYQDGKKIVRDGVP
jgi:hypothetical protein